MYRENKDGGDRDDSGLAMTEAVKVRLSWPEKVRLERICKERGTTVSQHIRWVLDRFVEVK